MNYNALIFDMDGTLVHNMPVHDRALEDTLAEAGIPLPADRQRFHASLYGKKTAEVFRMLLGSTARESDVLYWAERKESLYRERFARARQPMPGLLPFLKEARRLGLSMAIASAAPPENIAFILEALHLGPWFQAVVSGQDVQHGKPHPQIFLQAARALGVSPARCLVFEDAPQGLEAARRAGMDAVLICTSLSAWDVAGMPHVRRAVADYTQLDLRALLGP